jgi:AcrR family transcriptional regulator
VSFDSSQVQGARPLRDRLREETSRTILEAAEAVLAEEGLQARMESIAARAGVAVGTLYNHFEHRYGLVDALVRARREALLARVDAALGATGERGAADQLRAFLTAIAEHGRAHGPLLAALVQAGEGPGSARPPVALFADLSARVEAILAAGVASGELRSDGAGVFAQALVGMARAVLFRALEASGDTTAAVDAVLDLFLRGARA